MLIALVETMVFSYSRVMRRESIWFILAVPGHMWMSWQRRARKIVVTRVKEDTGKSQLWRGHCRAHVHTRPTDKVEYSTASNCRFQIRPGGKDGWNESTAGCRYKRVFSMFCYGGKAVVAVNQVAPLAVRCQKKKGTRGCFLTPSPRYAFITGYSIFFLCVLVLVLPLILGTFLDRFWKGKDERILDPWSL